jgi:hypothetical protein
MKIEYRIQETENRMEKWESGYQDVDNRISENQN